MAYIGRQPNVERLNFTASSTDPANPSTGDIYYNDGTGTIEAGLRSYDGTNWNQVNYRKNNILMNGSFNEAQRGTAFTVSAGRKYLDRWISTTTFTGTGLVTRENHTLAELETSPAHYMRITQGSASYDVLQVVEDVRETSGKTYTLSFYARTSDSSNLNMQVVQHFGTGGSPSADVSVTSITSATTTSFQKFTATFTVPSVSGKTLGTNNDHGLRVFLSVSVGIGSATKDFSLMMMNEGATAAQFIPHGGSLDIERQSLKRYFEKSYDRGVNPGTAAAFPGRIELLMDNLTVAASRSISHNGEFKVDKRITPTITIYNPSSGASNSVQMGTGAFAPSTAEGGISGVLVSATDTGSTGFARLLYHYTADAEF